MKKKIIWLTRLMFLKGKKVSGVECERVEGTLDKHLYMCKNQINALALIGQSAVGYCASKLMEKSLVF